MRNFSSSSVYAFFPNSCFKSGTKEAAAAIFVTLLASGDDTFREVSFQDIAEFVKSQPANLFPVYHAMCEVEPGNVVGAFLWMEQEGYLTIRRDQVAKQAYLSATEKMVEFYSGYAS